MKSVLSLLVLLVCLSPSALAQTLSIGSPAPEIKASEWVKGEKLESLNPDETYVVEFWATWCPPCRASIPHLTELAHRFTNTTFIGMNIWERGDAISQKVTRFVEDMGDEMDYTVAIDTDDGYMAEAWMTAAGRRGIPSAFIIHDGRVAWIGHPRNMEDTLESIQEGTFDFDSAQEAASKETKEASELNKTLALLKEYIAAASQEDEEKTTELLRQIEEMDIQNPAFLNYLAWAILNQKGNQNPDLSLAIRFSEKAVKLSEEKNAAFLDTYARAMWDSGQLEKAIEYQKKAVALAPDDPGFGIMLEKYLDETRPGGPPLRLQTERFGMGVVVLDKAIYVLGGYSDNGFSGSVERWGPDAKTSEVLPHSTHPRRFHIAAPYRGKIYLAGGVLTRDDSMGIELTDLFEEFDPQTGQIRDLPDLPIAVSRAGIAVVDDRLYVVGGAEASDRRTPAVQIYDFETGAWSRGADMPVAREGQVFVHDGLIYAPGGYNGRKAIRDIQRYNPATDEWEELPRMPAKASAFQGLVVDDTLYLFGDYDELDQVVACNLDSGEWSRLQIPYKPARHGGAARLGDEVFVVGGNVQSGRPYLSRIQRFSIQQLADAPRTEWKPAPPRPKPKRRSRRSVREPPPPPNPEFFHLKWKHAIENNLQPSMTPKDFHWWIPARHILLTDDKTVQVHRADNGKLVHSIPLPDELNLDDSDAPNRFEFVYLQDGENGYIVGIRILYERVERSPESRSYRGIGQQFMSISHTGELLWLEEQDSSSSWLELYSLPMDADHDLLLSTSWNRFQILDPRKNVLLEQTMNPFDRWTFRATPDNNGIEILVIDQKNISCYDLTLPASSPTETPADSETPES